jgi:hypothetical protein
MKILLALAVLSTAARAEPKLGPTFGDMARRFGNELELSVPAATGKAVGRAAKKRRSQTQVTVTVELGGSDASKGPVEVGDLLKPLGVKFTKVTGGTKIMIVDTRTEYEGLAIVAPGPRDPNVMTQKGSNDPIGFSLTFERPVCGFSFTRPGLYAGAHGISHPRWSAEAFAGKDSLGKVSEAMIRYFDQSKPLPAKKFTLKGSEDKRISEVAFESDGRLKVTEKDGTEKWVHFAAFGGTLISNLEFEFCPTYN